MPSYENQYRARKTVLFGKVLWWDLQVNYVRVARLKPDKKTGEPIVCEKCTQLRLNPDLVKEACASAKVAT